MSRSISWRQPIGCRAISTGGSRSPSQSSNPLLQNRVKEVLEIQLADNVKGWWMQSDGRYARTEANDRAPLRSQERLYELVTAWPREPVA